MKRANLIRTGIGFLLVLLTFASALAAATDNWQRQDVDWQAGTGRRIKGIHYPEDRPVPVQSPRPTRTKRSDRRDATFYAAPSRSATAVLANEMLVESPNQMWTSVKVVIYLDEERETC